MSDSRTIASTIPTIVANTVDAMHRTGTPMYREIATLHSLVYKATAPNAIDVKVSARYRYVYDSVATAVLDGLDLGTDTGMITKVADGHYRLTW